MLLIIQNKIHNLRISFESLGQARDSNPSWNVKGGLHPPLTPWQALLAAEAYIASNDALKQYRVTFDSFQLGKAGDECWFWIVKFLIAPKGMFSIRSIEFSVPVWMSGHVFDSTVKTD